MKVINIFSADICRDGGSYSLGFHSDDGEWYEFFIQIKMNDCVAVGYEKPRLYFNAASSGKLIREFTWDEAKAFLDPLAFDNRRFDELVEVVNRRGCRP